MQILIHCAAKRPTNRPTVTHKSSQLNSIAVVLGDALEWNCQFIRKSSCADEKKTLNNDSGVVNFNITSFVNISFLSSRACADGFLSRPASLSGPTVSVY